ncbi:MAG: mucoidy inhibitor MuiA family protein, partial [Candidatus Krumholzibacteriaceae bacterium]
MKRTCNSVLARMLPAIFSLAALSLLAVPPHRAAASEEKELALETRIVTATVYADRAQVTRAGKIELAAGLYRLVCGDLPRGFSESSLQVEGKGTAQARIMGVDVAKVRGLGAESPRYKELKSKLDALTATRDTLQIQLNSLNSSVQFLDDFAKFPFEKGSTKLATEIFRVQDWKNVLEFIGAERVKTNEMIGGLNKRNAKLADDINWVTNQLNEMQTKDDWSPRVAVDCEIVSPGDLELSFTYNVSGATWTPEYLIRYDTAKESIDLAYSARVQQSTGEDWKDVAVVLSTARPQLGAAPPTISPLYVQRIMRAVEGVVSARAMKSGT